MKTQTVVQTQGQQWLEPTLFNTPSNRQLWLTFSMEETMKQLNNQTVSSKKKAKKLEKIYAILATLLMFFLVA